MKTRNAMLAIVALSCSMMTGCAKKPAVTRVQSGGSSRSTAALAAAQSYGTNAGGVIAAQNSPYAMHKNVMRAPANQTYYFAFDQSGVRPADVAYIQEQANYLAMHPKTKVRLEGNTDNKGSREYNIALGWRRDQAVARIMQLAGVKPSQLDMVSYGKEKPAVDIDVSNGMSVDAKMQLNRRVNLVYEG